MRGLMLVLTVAMAGGVVACGGDDGAGTGGEGAGASDGTGGAGEAGGSGATGGAGGTGGSGGAGGAAPQDVIVAFTAQVNGTGFACGTTYEVGSGDTSGELTDFRLYVHDVELLSGGDSVPVALEQDGVWQYENVALLDFEDKTGACANGTAEMNVTLRGTVPGDVVYDGLRFKLGVPFELNHDDASVAPSPLNLSGLFWNWQGGYKFLRADFSAEEAAGPFNLHLGSTGCDGDPSTGGVTACDRENVATIELAGFDVASNVVVVDYGAVMANSDLGVADAGGAPGCMSGPTDPECAPVFSNLGIDIATGDPMPDAQTLFSMGQ